MSDDQRIAAEPWYRNFFGEGFWRTVEQELDDALASDADELTRLLDDAAPGRRVLDVGSGVGTRALALGAAGYDVLGLDPSSWAVGEARRRARSAGIEARWSAGDPLAPAEWPTGTYDAALCVGCLGWGTDAEQRRLFRRLRRLLVPGGLLVVGGPPAWLGLPPFATAYDPVTGRSAGPGHDLRVYTPVELRALVRESGFEVVSSTEDRLVARSLPAPPQSLAVTAWRTPARPGLDLRYAPDEAELLTPAPSEIWETLVHSSPAAGADIVGGYAVDDPYGGERGSLVVGGYIGRPVRAGQLTFAAGVSSLLRDLAGLADGGTILAPAGVHGDLEAWAAAEGCEVRLVEEPAGAAAIGAALAAARPALLHLDRPTFAGDLLELDELEQLTATAATLGTIVVVDESALPYFGGRESGAVLANRTHNLVVLRGFTKGYSLGGMRVGYAVASPPLARRVRELVAPLQVGELALQAAFRLLAAGDIFLRLRERAAAVKPEVVELLEGIGLAVRPGRPELPWVAVDDPDGEAFRLLERRGIRALRPVQAPQAAPGTADVLRLTVPLAEDRLAAFRRLILDGANAPLGHFSNA